MIKKFTLKDKYSLITGSAGLLGESHAISLAEIRSNLILTDIRLQKMLNLKKLINKKFPDVKVYCFKMDVTKENNVKKILSILKKKNIKLNVLINNADLNSNYKKLKNKNHIFENFSLDYWNKNINVGLTGAFICSKIFGKEMVKNKGGVILNISSDLSVMSPNNSIYKTKNKQSYKPVSYSTVKTGLIGLTKYIATHWAKKNIRCNALSPGGIFDNQDKRFVSNLKKLIPMGRMARKDEYISTIQFLCTDASSYLTGQNIIVDGGRSSW